MLPLRNPSHWSWEAEPQPPSVRQAHGGPISPAEVPSSQLSRSSEPAWHPAPAAEGCLGSCFRFGTRRGLSREEGPVPSSQLAPNSGPLLG